MNYVKPKSALKQGDFKAERGYKKENRFFYDFSVRHYRNIVFFL